MNIEDFIWVGNTVLYDGARVVVMDIDIPYLWVSCGAAEPIKVRIDSVVRNTFGMVNKLDN